MEQIVENPMLLSIVTGIITFAITWPINIWLTKKIGKKDYYNRVDKANSNIIATCTDYIIMEKSVDDKVFNSIINGFCVENKVSKKDLINVSNLKSILVKDFVNMRLISDDVKREVIYKLCEEKQINDEVMEAGEVKTGDRIIKYELSMQNMKLTTSISGIFSFLIAAGSMIVALLNGTYPNIVRDMSVLDIIKNMEFSMSILALVLLIICLLYYIYMLKQRYTKHNDKNKISESDKNDV